MTEDLHAIEAWAGALLAKLQPAQRRAVNRKVAQDLRRSQSQRIAAQRQPDGSSFIPRKARKDLRGKAGRIKRQKMFAKLRTARFLKIEANELALAVGFFGRVGRIARVHQEGLTDKVAKNGPDYKYPARVLLGFSAADRERIRDALLLHLAA